MPLSWNGLCEALITTPRSARSSSTIIATAGVGMMPRKTGSPPTLDTPAANAASSIDPERRLSRPITTRGCFDVARLRADPQRRSASHRERELAGELAVGHAADAVGAEELSCHVVSCLAVWMVLGPRDDVERRRASFGPRLVVSVHLRWLHTVAWLRRPRST